MVLLILPMVRTGAAEPQGRIAAPPPLQLAYPAEQQCVFCTGGAPSVGQLPGGLGGSLGSAWEETDGEAESPPNGWAAAAGRGRCQKVDRYECDSRGRCREAESKGSGRGRKGEMRCAWLERGRDQRWLKELGHQSENECRSFPGSLYRREIKRGK